MFRDRHHLLNNRLEWSARPEAKALREQPSLIFKLDRSEHSELHQFTTPVPLLGYYALVRTNSLYEPGDTPLESVENLMRAIEQATNHPKEHEVQKQLGQLAVWALDLQTPWLAGKSYER